MSLGKATAEQVLAAVKAELALIQRRLTACRNRLYRETGTYPEDLGAALQRTEFLLHGILTGLITPAAANSDTAGSGQTGKHSVKPPHLSVSPRTCLRGARERSWGVVNGHKRMTE